MADFEVKTNQLAAVSGEFYQLQKKCLAVSNSAGAVFDSLRGSISSKITDALKRNVVCSNIKNSATDMSNLSATINKAVVLYKSSESKIRGGAIKSSFAVKAALNGAGSVLASKAKTKSLGEIGIDWVVGTVKKMGLIGNAVSVISGLFDEFKNPGDPLKNAYSIYKSIDSIRKEIEKMKKYSRFHMPKSTNATVWAKKFFGLTDYFAAVGGVSKAAKLTTRWYNNFRKGLMSEFDNLKKGSAKVGIAISGIINGILNYEEYKSGQINGARAITETITETAIDVGSDMLIGAGVAATIGAVCGAAPVVAVAAATVGIKMGADALTNWLTKGKYTSATEFVSDKLIDGTVAAWKGATKCAKTVGKALKAGWKKLKSLF